MHQRKRRLTPDNSRLLGILACFLLPIALATAENLDADTIVARNCTSCHASGAGGAPRLQHEADWAALFDRFTPEQVVSNAYEGRGRMPPRGFCSACSRDDIARAIEAMLPDGFEPRVRPEE